MRPFETITHPTWQNTSVSAFSPRPTTREDIKMALVPTYWQSISLDDMNAKAAMQTRIDRKYIVEARYAAAVMAELNADAAVMEIKGQREFSYDSVYFDTPSLASYRAAATGRRNRFKVRTRSYLDSDLSFLEVKTEGERAMTVKERIPYQIENRDRLTPEGLDYVAESLNGLLDEPVTNLEPVLTTEYKRTTVFLPQSEENPVDSRMTVDTSLAWTSLSENALLYNVDFGNYHGRTLGTRYTAPGMVIIETKSGTAPSVADKHLWRAGIRPAKISKFATGMAALNPQLPANKWNRVIERWMQLSPQGVPLQDPVSAAIPLVR